MEKRSSQSGFGMSIVTMTEKHSKVSIMLHSLPVRNRAETLHYRCWLVRENSEMKEFTRLGRAISSLHEMISLHKVGSASRSWISMRSLWFGSSVLFGMMHPVSGEVR